MKLAIASKNMKENLDFIQNLVDDNYKYIYVDAIKTYKSATENFFKNGIDITIFDNKNFEFGSFNYISGEKIYISNIYRKKKLTKLL